MTVMGDTARDCNALAVYFNSQATMDNASEPEIRGNFFRAISQSIIILLLKYLSGRSNITINAHHIFQTICNTKNITRTKVPTYIHIDKLHLAQSISLISVEIGDLEHIIIMERCNELLMPR